MTFNGAAVDYLFRLYWENARRCACSSHCRCHGDIGKGLCEPQRIVSEVSNELRLRGLRHSQFRVDPNMPWTYIYSSPFGK